MLMGLIAILTALASDINNTWRKTKAAFTNR
jgi:hypothetical protein